MLIGDYFGEVNGLLSERQNGTSDGVWRLNVIKSNFNIMRRKDFVDNRL